MLLRRLILALVLCVSGIQAARAQETNDPLAELRARIEALERENRQMKAAEGISPTGLESAPRSPSDYVSLPQIESAGDDAHIRSVNAD
jgi:hypothetical protein